MTVLSFDDYKDGKNLIEKFEAAYGNKYIFRQAILKLLAEDKMPITVFGLHFGYQKEPMTYKAIAEHLNISYSCTRNYSYKAFRRLLHPGFRQKVWDECGYKPTLTEAK